MLLEKGGCAVNSSGLPPFRVRAHTEPATSKRCDVKAGARECVAGEGSRA